LVRAVVTGDTPVSKILAHCAAGVQRALAASAMHDPHRAPLDCKLAGAAANGGGGLLLVVYGSSQVAPADATIGSLGISSGDVLRIVQQSRGSPAARHKM
jgi:hypothetical protein